MAKNNSINNAAASLTVDQGASNSYIQFDVSGTGEFRIGVDDASSDEFKVSQGSALGTNDTFIMTVDGERTMPLQPSFYSYVSSDILNVTGDGTNYTIIFDSERFDIGSNFNTSTGTFTAPVDGIYSFMIAIILEGLLSTHTRSQCDLVVSTGNNVTLNVNNTANLRNNLNSASLSGSSLVSLTAGDTVTVRVNVLNGTKVVDIGGSAGGSLSTFSGILLA